MTNLNPIKISNYASREERMKSINSRSVRDLFTLANLATALFVIFDFAVLYSRWETVQTESWYMVSLIAISSATILDVPMMLAGKAIVEYHQKLKKKETMLFVVSLSVAAFLLVFSFSVWFSYVTRNATFQDAETSTLVNTMTTFSESTDGESMSILSAAMFSSVLPLGTSIASLVITLMSYNPKEEKLKKIEKAKVKAEQHLLHLRQGIAESKAYIEHAKNLLAREKDLYYQFVESVYAQELVRENAFKEALEKKCSLDDVNHIMESAKRLNASYSFNDVPYSETSDNLEKLPNLSKYDFMIQADSAKKSA